LRNCINPPKYFGDHGNNRRELVVSISLGAETNTKMIRIALILVHASSESPTRCSVRSGKRRKRSSELDKKNGNLIQASRVFYSIPSHKSMSEKDSNPTLQGHPGAAPAGLHRNLRSQSLSTWVEAGRSILRNAMSFKTRRSPLCRSRSTQDRPNMIPTHLEQNLDLPHKPSSAACVVRPHDCQCSEPFPNQQNVIWAWGG
jgi:hypothetical protein